MPPDFSLERRHGAEAGRRVAGLDEAGRGPLAGPVAAAAVRLDPGKLLAGRYAGLADSKLLSARRREALHSRLLEEAEVGLGWASVEEIDRMNILAASLLAMRRALLQLGEPCERALVDGNRLPPDLPCPSEAVVGGDRKVLSIAAASIVAKVERDRVMADLDRTYPGYGWARNKGYPTREHRAALTVLGPSPAHRLSFAPLRLARAWHRGA